MLNSKHEFSNSSFYVSNALSKILKNKKNVVSEMHSKSVWNAASNAKTEFIGFDCNICEDSMLHKRNVNFASSNSGTGRTNSCGLLCFAWRISGVVLRHYECRFWICWCNCLFFRNFMNFLTLFESDFKEGKFRLSECKVWLSNLHVHFHFDLRFGRFQYAFGKGNLKLSNWVLLS